VLVVKKHKTGHTVSSAAGCLEKQRHEHRAEPVESSSSIFKESNINTSGEEGIHPSFWPQLANQQFLENISKVPCRSKSRHTNRMRSYWKSVRTINTIRFQGNDKQLYAEVQLLDWIIIGLLDTGAAISEVGGNLAKQIIQSKHSFKQVATAACTSDGKRQEVIGRFRTPVPYKGSSKIWISI